MQSFFHGSLLHDSGYFHIWISSVPGTSFFLDQTDKAYFMTLIQDSLSPRSRLEGSFFQHRHYSADIDLLAYSLNDNGIHLLVHTTRKSAIDELGQTLLLSYQAYIQESARWTKLPFDSIFMFDKLIGRHEALNVSKEIHLLHDDWRHDRYSSIGFYLDDRRGDWMRPYRLMTLFNAKPKQYLRFLRSQETEPDRIFEYIET